MMKWETPTFVEINMSAEIGGYGSDFTDRDPWGPVVTPVDSAVIAERTKTATPLKANDPYFWGRMTDTDIAGIV